MLNSYITKKTAMQAQGTITKKESGYMPGSALVSHYTRLNYSGISMIVIN